MALQFLKDATFTGRVTIGNDSGDTLLLTKSNTEPAVRFQGDTDKDFVLTVSGETFTVTKNDGFTDILTLDHDTKAATFSGNVSLTGGLLSITSDGSNAVTFTESGAGLLTIAVPDDFNVNAGSDMNFDANGGDFRLLDGGTVMGRIGLENGDLNIDSVRQDYDMRFKGNDGGSVINALVLDMSNSGAATFSGDVIGGTSKTLKSWRRLQTDANDDWGLNNNAGSSVIAISAMGTPSTSTTTFAGNITAPTLSLTGLTTNPASTTVLVKDETLGPELVSNPSFTTGVAGWNLQNSSTVTGGIGTINAVGSLSSTGGNWSIYQSNPAVFTPNKKYLANYTVRRKSGTGRFQIAYSYGIFVNQILTTSFQTFSVYYDTNSNNWTDLTLGGDTSGDVFEISYISVKQVTSVSDQIKSRELGSGAFGDELWAVTPTDSNNIYNLNSGNVGIGTTTPDVGGAGSSSTVLSVIETVGTRRGILELGDNQNADTGGIGSINFVGTYQDAGHKVMAEIRASGSGSTSGKRGSFINFFTKQDNVANIAERMRITAAGALEIKGSSTTASAQAFITNDNSLLSIGSSVSGSVVKDIQFSSPSAMMYIDGSTGNVGINETSPKNRLEVKGLFAAPLTTGSVQNGIARFSQTSGVGSLDIGFGDTGNGFNWLQSRSSANYATNFNLALQPNGGNVGIGTTAPIASANKNVLGIQGVWGGQLDIMVGTVSHAQFGTDNFSTGNSARIQSKDAIVFKVNGGNVAQVIGSNGNIAQANTSPIADPFTGVGGEQWMTYQIGKGGVLGAYKNNDESMFGFNTYVSAPSGVNKAIISGIGGTATRYYANRITFNTLTSSGTTQTQTERMRITSGGDIWQLNGAAESGTYAPWTGSNPDAGIAINVPAGSVRHLSFVDSSTPKFGGGMRYFESTNFTEIYSVLDGTATTHLRADRASPYTTWLNPNSIGRVGIGITSAPIEKLQVSGQIISTGSNSTVATTGAQRAIMDLSGFSATDTSARFGHFRGATAAGAGQMRLYTDSVERVRIDASGNVGIGEVDPGYKLDVAGTIRATGDVIAFSDERVKENIKTISNSLEKVSKLRGVEFNKIGEDIKSIGVIAQEIEKVIPEVVREDDKGMKSVAYGNITGILIEAIKELKQEIEELKKKPCNCK